jgi:hypothetical protein
MRVTLLLAALALAGCREGVEGRGRGLAERLPAEAKAAIADLKELAAAEAAQFQIRGAYAGIEELKRHGLLTPGWPRSGYTISCEAGDRQFACTADPQAGEHHFFVDGKQQLRYAKGARASAASEALGPALPN